MLCTEVAHDGCHPIGSRLTAMVCSKSLQRTSGKERRRSIGTLNQEAAEIAPGSEGLFFLPYLAGERTPHADSNARGCFIGLTNKHSRGHMARAVMEGVAYSLRECLEIIRSLDIPVKEISYQRWRVEESSWTQSWLIHSVSQHAKSMQNKVLRTELHCWPQSGMVRIKTSKKLARPRFRLCKKRHPKNKHPKFMTLVSLYTSSFIDHSRRILKRLPRSPSHLLLPLFSTSESLCPQPQNFPKKPSYTIETR